MEHMKDHSLETVHTVTVNVPAESVNQLIGGG